METTVKP